ncbi:MAG: nuclear transport factor 2 family protein [Anaerolineae bacterium]
MEDTQAAVSLVKRYLRTLESRSLDTASSMLAHGATIVFPGASTFQNLDEVVAHARERYQWVRKTFEHVNSMSLPEGETVVYVTGRLHGVNLHGVEFSGVRFVDRFVLREGMIVSQEVWNDLAETGVLDKKNG